MNGPATNSLRDISAYIREYIDPQANLTGDEDAEATLAALNEVFAADGGTGLTVAQLADYLASLSN